MRILFVIGLALWSFVQLSTLLSVLFCGIGWTVDAGGYILSSIFRAASFIIERFLCVSHYVCFEDILFFFNFVFLPTSLGVVPAGI